VKGRFGAPSFFGVGERMGVGAQELQPWLTRGSAKLVHGVNGMSEMGPESGKEAVRVAPHPVTGGREVVMPVITAVAVVVAALSVVASVLDSRIDDLRTDMEQIKRDVGDLREDVGDLREDVAYIKGRIDDALKRPE